MVFVTNRYAVHVMIVAIAFCVIALNVHTTEVRAESFGEESLMYSIVTNQDTEIIEETKVEAVDVSVVNYRPNTALSAVARGVDSITFADSAISILGGSALAVPTISEGAESTAPRTDVETYIVQSGDTLSTIASKFGISLNTLLWANDLTVRSVLKPGAELSILPVSGVQHTVASGDTVSSIAKKYDVDESEIIKFNRLASAEDIVTGENLIVPGGVVVAPTPVTRPSSVASVFTQPSSSIAVPAAATADVTASGVMIWPTDLHIITQYYGWNHTGIDVDCYDDNTNYAADDGIVTFAGWNSGGYGNFVIIDHGNGIVTRYGHHASLYVTAGQSVTKGQPIGMCGTTGRSTGTHLHFEVMVNGKFKNPLEYIR